MDEHRAGRILYVGNSAPGWTGRDRIEAFEAAGFAVEAANRHPFLVRGSKVERAIAARWHLGRAVAGYNRLLAAHAERADYDIVFVDKGVWVWPDTLAELKRGARRDFAIHYTPDAQFLENRSRHFFRGLPLYDLAITTKSFELPQYRAAGVGDVMLLHQGYGSRFADLGDPGTDAQLASEIAFIGHCQPAYAAFLKRIAVHLPLSIWGPGWTGYARRNAWARDVVRGEGFYGADYPRALAGARIALGLLSKRIPETATTRSFEIPASGTMLLAERTDEHAALFEEGVEAEFFADAEECVEKALRYLADHAAREKMAAAGRERCRASGYSVQAQFAKVIETIGRQTGLECPPAVRYGTKS